MKQIDGDNNEYWYDADNNRINMNYYQTRTSMQYLYDCSGGRSRLLWTSDHNENVTSYFYGAEGLLWSRCNGEYQVYHYDYRGSVVAVTDIDGNVTDTLKYDAYGSVSERTGDSALIFTYNGQYGVLTDPNGLLYMRTRFYNPELKRFMNADIIDGSIADSTSLNLYTFVNGNPISFVDPFGLSKDDRMGLVYNGNLYPIFVPNHLISTVEPNWKTVHSDYNDALSFDWAKFIVNLQLDDFDENKALVDNPLFSCGLSLFSGVLSATNSAADNLYVRLDFQEAGGQRRVIITTGSSVAKRQYDYYIGGSHSMYWSFDSAFARASISDAIGSAYQQMTGESIGLFDLYDMEITVDSAHGNSGDISYLWLKSDGTVMETPIIYPNDKVEIGKLSFFGYRFTPLIDVPLGESSPIASEYQGIFNELYKAYGGK